MDKSKKILRLIEKMARYAALLSTAALLVILVAILIGVFFRVMRLPIGGIIEINQFLIVISIFLGCRAMREIGVCSEVRKMSPSHSLTRARPQDHHLSSAMLIFTDSIYPVNSDCSRLSNTSSTT